MPAKAIAQMRLEILQHLQALFRVMNLMIDGPGKMLVEQFLSSWRPFVDRGARNVASSGQRLQRALENPARDIVEALFRYIRQRHFYAHWISPASSASMNSIESLIG